MKIGSLFAGIGGFDIGFERAGFEVAWCAEWDRAAQAVLRTRFPRATVYGDIREIDLDALAPVDVICGGFQCQASAPDSPAQGVDYSMTQCGSFDGSTHPSSFSRMSPDCCRAITDSTSPPSSVKWAKAGIVRRSDGEFWTVSTSEWPNDAVVCSLSEVLEPDAPSRYSLSPKAAAGILRRAERRGKRLPEKLKEALLLTAAMSPTQ